MEHYNFPIVIEHDKDGYFAFCPGLQGCYTQGRTYEDAVSNIKDAIKLHIADRRITKEGVESRQSVSISMVEVTV